MDFQLFMSSLKHGALNRFGHRWFTGSVWRSYERNGQQLALIPCQMKKRRKRFTRAHLYTQVLSQGTEGPNSRVGMGMHCIRRSRENYKLFREGKQKEIHHSVEFVPMWPSYSAFMPEYPPSKPLPGRRETVSERQGYVIQQCHIWGLQVQPTLSARGLRLALSTATKKRTLSGFFTLPPIFSTLKSHRRMNTG